MFYPDHSQYRDSPQSPRSRRWFRCVRGAVLVMCTATASAQQLITNGGFDQELSGWEVRGSVAGSSGIAVVADENASASLLFQPVNAGTGLFNVQFDFRNALSSTVPPGRLPDTFFATLYFTNDPSTLNIPAGVYDRAIALFDLDFRGPFNVNGSLTASGKGAEWSLFRLSFESTHSFIVPAFELRDLNLVNDDSAVAIDNVALFVIPEPRVVPLTGAAAGLLAGIARRRRGAHLSRTM